MKFNRLYTLRLPCLVLYCLLAGPTALAADPPLIAAAASVKFALQDIAAAFAQATGHTVRVSYSSSGNLTRQIQQGGPYELFLSANSAYIETLQQHKLTRGPSVTYAQGRLVMLTASDSSLTPDPQLQDLKAALQDGRLQRFAIANPEHAPYGEAAREVLQSLQLWQAVQPYLVLGENVAQATQFATSGAAQGALTSYSLALAPVLRKQTRFVLIPQNLHRPLRQTMVLLNRAGSTAEQFFHFLQQEKARSILSRYGYSAP